MPRINRRARLQKPGLTHAQELDLVLGPGVGAFGSLAARRRAWIDNADALMASVGSMARPAAFWDYEGFVKHPGEKCPDALRRLELLTAKEKLIDARESKSKEELNG